MIRKLFAFGLAVVLVLMTGTDFWKNGVYH